MANGHDASASRFMLSTDAFNKISSILKELEASTRADLAVFCESNGIPITQVGRAGDFDMSSLATLVAANFAATQQMAKMLGEKDGFRYLYLEGEKRNIYMCDVGFGYSLTVVFTQSVALGMLRIYANRAVKQLSEVLQGAHENEKANEKIFDNEFASLLGDAFDASFKNTH